MHVAPRSGTVRDRILLLRGRAGLTQLEVAALVRVSRKAVQKWEAGEGYPSPARLQALIALYLERGVFSAGHEAEEAQALWEALRREAAHNTPPFDGAWFATLRPAAPLVPEGAGVPPSPASGGGDVLERSQWQAWGEAPDVAAFQGRTSERELLERWLMEERCRVVALLGLGGIGKTALATRAAHDLAPRFAGLCWRSLRNAPPPEEWLADAIAALAAVPPVLPAGLPARLRLLLAVLRERRGLLVLDNLESVLEPGAPAARYRAGYEGYGTVLRQIAESVHQSTLVLTAREAPPELALVEGSALVRTLRVGGLDPAACRSLLEHRALQGDDATWQALVARYGGNPLVLNLIAHAIVELFGGEIEALLAYAVETFGAVFGGIRRLLEEQFERLSALEQSLLTWLAIEREPVGVAALRADLASGVGPGAVLEALEALGRRSLLERGGEPPTHTLQPVVLEYASERLVEALAQEIVTGQPVLLVRHAVVKATSKDYVRCSQERLLAQPLLQQLVAACGDAEETERRLVELLEGWRGRPQVEQGYGPGNVVNLLRLLRGDLRGLDLSRLFLRHMYLQGVDAQDASLAGAHLAEAVLGEAFAYPTAVALSADGALLVAGTPTGEARLWRAADRTPLLAAQGHSGGVWSVALSGDGRLVARGGDDGVVSLWDPQRGPRSGQLLAAMRGHVGLVRGVALSGDGRLAASGGVDGTVRLWEAPSGQPLATLQGHTGGVWSVALSDDGRLVASGGVDGTVRLWEAPSGRPLATLQGHSGAVYGVALSGDGRLVASGGVDGTVRLWEAPSGRLLATLQGHIDLVMGLALSGDGRLVASGGVDGTVKLWEAESGRVLATLQGHSGAVMGVALSGDGRLAASASFDGMVRLWDPQRGPRSGQLLAALQGHTGMIRGLAFSGDGRLAASGGVDGMVRLWEAPSGRPLATLQGHTGGVWSVAFSRDGRLVASGGLDGTVRLWEAPSGQLLAALQGHTGAVWGIALSSDGRLVASGGDDGAVRLWDPRSGACLRTLRSDRRYERLDITGLTGVTEAQRAALLALGAFDREAVSG
jgi:WD40 repeat protein/transcriptional regulator with XRE-family HTH domain